MSTSATSLFPDTEIQIQSPNDFVAILHAVRDAIAQRILVQLRPTGAPFALDDLSAVSDSGPWPDYVEAYFESATTGARYKLVVETYHGVGGSWERC